MRFLVFILSIFLYGCNSSSELPNKYSPPNKLLQIEDLDGKDGLYSGRFGDIVVYDPILHIKYVVTDDKYFNMYPCWADRGKSIIFESKRLGKISLLGLSLESHIFKYNLQSKEIFQIDKGFEKEFKPYVSQDNSIPVLNKDGDKMVFASSDSLGHDNLILYDFESNTIKLLKRRIQKLTNIVWDDKRDILAYCCKIIKGFNRKEKAIVINNLRTDSTIVIGKENWRYNIGVIKGDTLLFTGYEMKFNSKEKLYIFDLRRKVEKLIYESKESFLTFSNPVFKTNSEIYFIEVNSKDDRGLKYDIVLLNLKNNMIQKITNDGKDKASLPLF